MWFPENRKPKQTPWIDRAAITWWNVEYFIFFLKNPNWERFYIKFKLKKNTTIPQKTANTTNNAVQIWNTIHHQVTTSVLTICWSLKAFLTFLSILTRLLTLYPAYATRLSAKSRSEILPLSCSSKRWNCGMKI